MNVIHKKSEKLMCKISEPEISEYLQGIWTYNRFSVIYNNNWIISSVNNWLSATVAYIIDRYTWRKPHKVWELFQMKNLIATAEYLSEKLAEGLLSNPTLLFK